MEVTLEERHPLYVCAYIHAVSILILMEVTLEAYNHSASKSLFRVSILILMEVTLEASPLPIRAF